VEESSALRDEEEVDASVQMLGEAHDDFTFARLLDAQAQVKELTQLCGYLRSQQVMEHCFLTHHTAPQTTAASPALLEQQIIMLTEQAHDAQDALAHLVSEAKCLAHECQQAKMESEQARGDAARRAQIAIQDYFGAATEGQLRAQVAELEAMRARLEGRLCMLELQGSEGKAQLKRQQRVLMEERNLHANTDLIEQLRARVQVLEEQVRAARANPLEMLRIYNGQAGDKMTRSMSSEASMVEDEKRKRYPELRQTALAFEVHINTVCHELYHQKALTLKWRNAKMAVDHQLAATMTHLTRVEHAKEALEVNAEVRAEKLRPPLRAARLELVRACFDLADATCKRNPDVALGVWQRGFAVLEHVEDGVAAEWHTDPSDERMHFGLEGVDRGNAWHKMGVIHFDSRHFVQAHALFEQSLQVREAQQGADHISTRKSRLWLERAAAQVSAGVSQSLDPSSPHAFADDLDVHELAALTQVEKKDRDLLSPASPVHVLSRTCSVISTDMSTDFESHGHSAMHAKCALDRPTALRKGHDGSGIGGSQAATQATPSRAATQDKPSRDRALELGAELGLGRLQVCSVDASVIRSDNDVMNLLGQALNKGSRFLASAPRGGEGEVKGARGAKFYGQFDSFVK